MWVTRIYIQSWAAFKYICVFINTSFLYVWEGRIEHKNNNTLRNHSNNCDNRDHQ